MMGIGAGLLFRFDLLPATPHWEGHGGGVGMAASCVAPPKIHVVNLATPDDRSTSRVP